MKQLSVNQIKRGDLKVKQPIPRGGSKLRMIHDEFMNRGYYLIQNPKSKSERSLINQLRLWYGLNIRSSGRNLYWLDGEIV